MANVLIVDTATTTATESLTSFIEFLPTLLMATLVLVVGIVIALGLGRFATELANYTNLDSRAANTPLAALFAGRPQVAAITGAAVKAYGIVVALYMAAGYAGFDGLAAWLTRLVDYTPRLIGGLGLMAAGLIVSAYAIRAVERSASGITRAVLLPVVQGLLYFMVVVIGLDTMGINVEIVYVVGETLSTAVGFGVALALGLAVGLGSKEYVAAHVDEWADGAASAGGGAVGSAAGGDSSPDGAVDDGSADDTMSDDWDDGGMSDDGDSGMADDWDDDGGDDWDDDGVEDLSDDWEDDF